jgi:nucleoside-diphosphate-sugar epimerase
MKNSIIEEDIKFITEADLPWHEFNNKSVLITGASGLIPAYMVRTFMFLNQKGYNIKVYALVRNKKYAEKVFEEFLNFDNFQLIVQDVCTPAHIDGELDYIIHAASKASPKYFKIDPVGVIAANTLGTYNCLELAREKKVSGFLFFSSGDVYGKVDLDKIPHREMDYGYLDPLDVSAAYGESKRLGETMCASWFYQHGVPAKVVRPCHIYGPGMKLDDGRVFADFVRDVINGHNIELKSDGKATRTFCYLADATRGFFTVLLKGENNNAYNLGNINGEISIKDLAELLVKLFPKKNLKVVNAKSNEYIRSKTAARGYPDTKKIMSLGWKPHYGIHEGFKRTIESFI